MGGHKEVPFPRHCYTSVYYCAVFDIFLVAWVRALVICRVKPGMMALDSNQDGNLRLRETGQNFSTRLANSKYLFSQNGLVLTIGNA